MWLEILECRRNRVEHDLSIDEIVDSLMKFCALEVVMVLQVEHDVNWQVRQGIIILRDYQKTGGSVFFSRQPAWNCAS